MDEKEYLSSNYSYESMQRAKKSAKIWIVLSFIGGLAAISATGVFLFEYKLVLSPLIAFLSVILAGMVLYIHFQFIQNVWQIWTNQLKNWKYFGLIAQVAFLNISLLLLVLAITNGQSFNVESYYIGCIWCLVCWKWAFVIYYQSNNYRTMFTKYAMIQSEGEFE